VQVYLEAASTFAATFQTSRAASFAAVGDADNAKSERNKTCGG